MILSFSEANEFVLSGLEKEAKEGRKNFGLELDSLCLTCCHNNECAVRRYGVCNCNYYDAGE